MSDSPLIVVPDQVAVLNLIEPVLTAACDLLAAYPFVAFTSGRRTLEAQARGMAEDVVAGGPTWLMKTYAASRAKDLCMAWLNENPGATAEADIQAGLLGVLGSLSDLELGQLSKHPAGLAFDVQPIEDPDGSAVKSWLAARAVSIGGKFLEKEGKLIRWHLEA